MPDDLQIPLVTASPGSRPTASYRPGSYRKPRALPVRAVAIAGAAGCALLLAVVGGWSLTHRHPAAIPVVEADARPIRIKPDNPGGMQLTEGDAAASASDQRIAPAAEAPAPQALRAQMAPPPAPPAATPTAAPAPEAPPTPAMSAPAMPAPTTPTRAAAGISPLPDTPTPAPTRTATPARPAPALATAPTTAAITAPTTTGAIAVQVAALDSEPAAQAEWQRLQKRMPDLLADRRPLIQKAERDSHPIWRLRLAGFPDIAEATAFCAKVRTHGGNCAIASF